MSGPIEDETGEPVDWADITLDRLIAECGIMAAGYGLTEQAQIALNAVHDADPKSAAPDIGLAILLVGSNRADEALTLLRAARDRVGEKDRAAVVAMIGWLLERAGHRSESRSLMQELAADNDDGPGQLAKAILAGDDRR
ncbi:MAG: hypothetical protein AAFY56_15575 [Pseudomonadota bacterium]